MSLQPRPYLVHAVRRGTRIKKITLKYNVLLSTMIFTVFLLYDLEWEQALSLSMRPRHNEVQQVSI